ncbi:MAG: hypothetical protein [Wendovervirus sonii]|uniref:Uncharacterized protein n=1 Tax=phage Lak_Megaphage_Sonny TaxID=3109229 RepID=A0ABZ0Z3T3_9CAUD|nr:MAG: hypothetical protein [phage Lak_Megaphage_Sonny]
MYTYTFNDIKSGWIKRNSLFINEFAVSDKNGDDIDRILVNIKEFIDKYQISENDERLAVNESIFDKLMNKAKKGQEKGISSAEYVAINTGYTNKANSEKSFYDKHHEIDITLEDNSKVKGIIRVSDHYINLQKWAENNTNYDFGISFVIQETSNEYQGNNIIEIPNRNICIFEYVYEYNRKNIGMLNQLISEILLIKRTGKYISNKVILNIEPNIVNSSLLEKVKIAIKEGLNKIFN